MRCLISNENLDVEALKIHCQYYHSISEDNYFFRELFLPDNNSKKCDERQVQFKNCRKKKNYNFLFYRHQQTGGAINQQLPVNVLKRGPIPIILSISTNTKIFMIFMMKKLLMYVLILLKTYFSLIVKSTRCRRILN